MTIHVAISQARTVKICTMSQITEIKPTVQTANSNMFRNNTSASTSDNNARTMSTLALPPALRAMTATFNTAELLEHILAYLPAPQLILATATCRNFHNAIAASPTLRRKMSTYLRLNDVIDEKDLFQTNTGGEVVYPIRDLEPLAFFYPSDGERRLFVRFSVTGSWDAVERLRKASGFGDVRVVDQVVAGAVVGWHCGCFAGGRAEARVSSEDGRVTFGELFEAMDGRHERGGLESCRCLTKFWLDGVWMKSREMRQLGC